MKGGQDREREREREKERERERGADGHLPAPKITPLNHTSTLSANRSSCTARNGNGDSGDG